MKLKSTEGKGIKIITEREFELLGYINLIYNTSGDIPTYPKMLKLMGLSSNGSLASVINSLVRKGYLAKSKLGKGNLIITDKGKMTDKIYRLCPMCGHLN